MAAHCYLIQKRYYSNSKTAFVTSAANYFLHDESEIEMMTGNAIVEKLCENSLVRKLSSAAKILEQKLNN